MKTLTKQRLLKIADAIEAAPPDRFDMKTWLTVRGDSSDRDMTTTTNLTCSHCHEALTLNLYGSPAWHVCTDESFAAEEAKQAA